MLAEVQARSIGGGLTLLFANVGNRVVRFASMLILARLLTPADFGIFAIVMTLAGIAGLLYELGLATATVQRATITPEQVSTLFWIHVAGGAAIALLGVLGAPWLGQLYDDDRITLMCRLLALGPLFGALGLQHLALLQRALHFRRTATIGMTATTAGTVVTVLLAWQGFSFVALGVGVLVTRFLSTALAWRSCAWRPGAPRMDPAVREILVFGSHMLAFGALSALANGLHSMLLGLTAGVENTGIYYRAASLLQIVYGMVLGPVATVATTSLSHLKDRPEDFRHYYLRSMTLLCSVCAPAAALGWLFSDELVQVLFGAQWTASGPLFATMCVGAIFFVLSHSTGWIYIATGNPARMMRWGLIGWPAVMAGTLIGIPLGLQGLAIAQTVTLAIIFVPCMTMAFRGTQLTWGGLVESLWRPLLAALVATAGVLAAGDLLPASSAPRLLLGSLLFGLAYLAMLSEALGQRPQLLQFARELFGRVAPRMERRA
jgi:O-antigen/teichoic acid export membrane protein